MWWTWFHKMRDRSWLKLNFPAHPQYSWEKRGGDVCLWESKIVWYRFHRPGFSPVFSGPPCSIVTSLDPIWRVSTLTWLYKEKGNFPCFCTFFSYHRHPRLLSVVRMSFQVLRSLFPLYKLEHVTLWKMSTHLLLSFPLSQDIALLQISLPTFTFTPAHPCSLECVDEACTWMGNLCKY